MHSLGFRMPPIRDARETVTDTYNNTEDGTKKTKRVLSDRLPPSG